MGRGTSAASFAAGLPFCARLALRRRPPNPPDVCCSSPDVVPAFRSFLVPRLPKKEERRFSVGVVVAPGVAASPVVLGAPVAAVCRVGSGLGSVTGLSSCGAVDDTVDGSSFAGTAGAVSVAAGVVAGPAVSFLPKRPPKREARLFGLAAVSRVLDDGVLSAATASVAAVPVPGTAVVSSAPVDFPSAGSTGSPITREAVRISR